MTKAPDESVMKSESFLSVEGEGIAQIVEVDWHVR